jgi:single-strand DNA-binding protein
VAWGKTGELCAQYLSKGRSVYIEGRLQTREWEDKEGQKRSTTEIVAQNVTFLGGPRGAQGGGGGGGEPPRSEPSSAPPASDEIPF